MEDMFNISDNASLEEWGNMTSNVTANSQFIDTLQFICWTYIVPTICLFGILCNILNLLILTERHLKESPYSYLTAMASVDLCALVLMFLIYVFAFNNNDSYFWRFYESHLFYPFVNICTNSSIWLTVMLTIERFLYVCHPIWAKIYCDKTSTNAKIAIIITCIVVINIPRFLTFYVRLESSVENPRYIRDSTAFRHTHLFTVINWFYSIVINFIPLIVLSISNTYLVYAVQQARRQRQVMEIRNNREETWNREQMRLTITLVSIVFLFLVCYIPSAFADRPAAYALFGNGMTMQEFIQLTSYKSLQTVSNVLVCCNLSLNFVLYCAFNEKFVRVLKIMLTRWKHYLCAKSDGKRFQKLRLNKSMITNGTTLSNISSSGHSEVTPCRTLTTT